MNLYLFQTFNSFWVIASSCFRRWHCSACWLCCNKHIRKNPFIFKRKVLCSTYLLGSKFHLRLDTKPKCYILAASVYYNTLSSSLNDPYGTLGIPLFWVIRLRLSSELPRWLWALDYEGWNYWSIYNLIPASQSIIKECESF